MYIPHKRKSKRNKSKRVLRTRRKFEKNRDIDDELKFKKKREFARETLYWTERENKIKKMARQNRLNIFLYIFQLSFSSKYHVLRITSPSPRIYNSTIFRVVEYLAPGIDRGKIDLLIFHPLPTAVLPRPEKARASTRTSLSLSVLVNTCRESGLENAITSGRLTCLLYMINVANIVENVYHVDERWKKHFHTTKEYISIASSVVI